MHAAVSNHHVIAIALTAPDMVQEIIVCSVYRKIIRTDDDDVISLRIFLPNFI